MRAPGGLPDALARPMCVHQEGCLMRWLGRQPAADKAAVSRLDLRGGERALASARDDNTGAVVVATSYRLAVVREDAVVLDRPWSDVDAGQWDPHTWTLSITWVDRSRAGQWTFKNQDTRMPEVVHERVQASVVLAAPLALAGRRQTGRVVVRKNLADGRLFVQEVLGRGVRPDDPDVALEVARVSADLKDQVGL
ncbi:hypothetical protein G9U51_16875 [Calidifontibacter sp. DB0510]|uniref:Uncharacterized protein n=1 Tax=Metallococcus carri TaxID=1656884 RepID=A0A967B341_9MICO|nr:hypothetical protein [Metallococcus carri]NHN57443.1 hypothetical protein [Metallococcus carri]NOP39161.1 hypothetical protein [Calidifontibacter sp. DB2511S]